MTIEIERATDLPMGRPPRNDDPPPVGSAFPITAAGAERLRTTLLPNVKDAPLTKPELQEVVSRILLPVVFDDLGFLGLPEPDIRILARWMPEAPEPGASGDECSTSAVTRGRVQILPFALAFATLCRTVGASTTAHRRYKDAFQGERIRIVLDADRNDAQMYMSDDLRDALNDGFACWAGGR